MCGGLYRNYDGLTDKILSVEYLNKNVNEQYRCIITNNHYK